LVRITSDSKERSPTSKQPIILALLRLLQV